MLKKNKNDDIDPFDETHAKLYEHNILFNNRDDCERRAKADYGMLIGTDNHKKYLARLRALPYEEYLETPHWKFIRKEALACAGHRCQVCNDNRELSVHHRKYDRLGEERTIWEPDVIVLCDACHKLFHRKLPAAPVRGNVERHLRQATEAISELARIAKRKDK
jgi:5-methylcytosine-specific restriction endonuclease McrA